MLTSSFVAVECSVGRKPTPIPSRREGNRAPPNLPLWGRNEEGDKGHLRDKHTVLPLEKGELEGDENPLNPKILRKEYLHAKLPLFLS